MNRIALLAGALVVTASTAPLAFSGPATAPVEPIPAVLSAGVDLTDIGLTPLKHGCPDLGLVANQTEQADGSIRVTIRIVNRSQTDFSANEMLQQLVVVGRNGGRSDTVAFGSVPSGAEIEWSDVFEPHVAPATYVARIAYAPEIRRDGHPGNDDCHKDNDRVALVTQR